MPPAPTPANMLTNELAQQMYTEAAEALKAIIANRRAPAAAKARARTRLEELSRDYLDWATDRIEKRTQAFAEFITKMSGVLTALRSAPALDATRRLQRIVEEAKAILKEASPEDET